LQRCQGLYAINSTNSVNTSANPFTNRPISFQPPFRGFGPICALVGQSRALVEDNCLAQRSYGMFVETLDMYEAILPAPIARYYPQQPVWAGLSDSGDFYGD
jgi:hypothetical protein